VPSTLVKSGVSTDQKQSVSGIINKHSMYETTVAEIIDTAEVMGLNEDHIGHLCMPDKVTEFKVDFEGKVYNGARVQYNTIDAGGHDQTTFGGFRFAVPDEGSDATELATGLGIVMMLKTGPRKSSGGAKGVLGIDGRGLLGDDNKARRVKLCEAIVDGLYEAGFYDKSRMIQREIDGKLYTVPPDVMAPDMYTSPEVMGYLVEALAKKPGMNLDEARKWFNGKSVEYGGLSARAESTGRGGAIYAMEVLIKHPRLTSMNEMSAIRVAIEGFGNAGSTFAMHMKRYIPNAGLTAVKEYDGVLVAEEGCEIDTQKLMENRRQRLPLKQMQTAGILFSEDSSQFWGSKPDVLIPAFKESTVDLSEVDELDLGRLRMVLPLANDALTLDALNSLTEAGVVVLPDFEANSGGVDISMIEHELAVTGGNLTDDEVVVMLEDGMRERVDNIFRVIDEFSSMDETLAYNMRKAGIIASIETLV